MSDLLPKKSCRACACAVPSSAHTEAIDILSKHLLVMYKQIRELDTGDFADRASRAAALRKRCHAVEASIKALEKSPLAECAENAKKEGAKS